MATTKSNTKIPSSRLIECKNGTMGNLIYKSNRQAGYVVEWDGFGDVQEIEFGELQTMRGSQRKFFEENWILIEDANVLKQLRVEEFYKHCFTTDNFDTVFKMTPAQIRERLAKISQGLKDAIVLRAKEMIASGELDSVGVIKAIGDMCGVDLNENI